ncbi:hypothetical protein EBR77_02060 [bacterium]|nr:hypothetical protein [bacterium]NBX77829.1 hypothetical protein [bacterium]
MKTSLLLSIFFITTLCAHICLPKPPPGKGGAILQSPYKDAQEGAALDVEAQEPARRFKIIRTGSEWCANHKFIKDMHKKKEYFPCTPVTCGITCAACSAPAALQMGCEAGHKVAVAMRSSGWTPSGSFVPFQVGCITCLIITAIPSAICAGLGYALDGCMNKIWDEKDPVYEEEEE